VLFMFMKILASGCLEGTLPSLGSHACLGITYPCMILAYNFGAKIG